MTVFSTLLPVFLVMALGWLLRVTSVVRDEHWPGLEHVTYAVFFPAFIIDTLARADLTSVPVLGVGGALIGAILVLAATLLGARRLLGRAIGLDGPSFTSLFQGATRWNTFVALAVAGNLHGQAGVALMAVAVAAMVPLLNVLAVVVLVRHAAGRPQTAAQVLLTLLRNPFIWSCAIGVALNLLPPLPKVIASAVEITGKPSLAVGLMVVGAGLDLRSLARPRPVHLVAVGLKLLALPLIAVLIARALGVAGQDLSLTLAAAAMPTASSAYVLARQMGGNAPLMAEIITLQTLFALVTIPVVLEVFGAT